MLKINPVTSGGVAQDRKRAIVHVPKKTAAAAATAARQPVVAAAAGVHTVTLVLPGGKEAVFRAGSGKSIYDIASYAGVHLPASCK
jgi:histidinol dehydrogenase